MTIWGLVWLFVFVRGALCIDAGSSSASVRIIGGVFATIEDHPYHLSLLYNKVPICGAALLSTTYAITVAHCLQRPGPYSVRTGSDYIDKGGTVIHIKQVIVHPKFDKNTVDYDISILFLDKPAILSSKVGPIRLPQEAEQPPERMFGQVTGGGYISPYFNVDSKQLRVVEVPVWSRRECSRVYAYGMITPRMFCAGLRRGGKDSCKGDSGGAFVFNRTLYGLVSWGFVCGQPGYPGIYTNIPTLRRFIREYTGL